MLNNDSIKVGIMSGRLSQKIDNTIQAFPHKSWKNEFFLAKHCGFDLIEWVFDLYPNPILTDEGIAEIKSLKKQTGVEIHSVCCDYFMEKRLFKVPKFQLEENLNMLKAIIEKCNKLNITILELPFVDTSSLKNINEENELVSNLMNIIPLAEQYNVFLTLETDLHPLKFRKFIQKFNSSIIQANYDSGNSASLGYDVKEELSVMRDWIKNIHIKDRLFSGPSVDLGKGNVDFDLFFKTLSDLNYKGDLIIQGARLDEYENPEETCTRYLKLVKQYVDKYFI